MKIREEQTKTVDSVIEYLTKKVMDIPPSHRPGFEFAIECVGLLTFKELYENFKDQEGVE